MKKVLMFVAVILLGAGAVFALYTIKDNRTDREEENGESVQNKDHTGTYEMYYAAGAVSMSDYDYFRIILEADGDCVVDSKVKGTSQGIKVNSTYEIKDGKIYIYSKSGSATITEVYDFIDQEYQEIHMSNQQIGDYTFTIKFKKISD